jgi:hypothetical protein
MNSDTEILVSEILAKSGAVAKCEVCGNNMVATEDGEAESMAYGMATNALKDGERGFRGMEREEVMGLVKRAITHAPSKCSSCS